MSKQSFYADGIRFECQGDGRCCLSRGRHAYVYLSFGDRKRMAALLGMTAGDFTRKYTQKTDGLVHLKEQGGECLFLRENWCAVYGARPRQCRTWPFWPENMHPKVWDRDVAPYCPGIGKGRLYTAGEIEDILAKKRDVDGCLYSP